MGYIGAGITRFNTADELTVTGDAQIDTTTLVVDSTNNRVGIGTASPAANRALHVSSTAQNHARFERTGAATSHIEFQDSTTTNQPSLGGVGDNLTFHTAFTERMRINSSGGVGIGTTSPTSKLSVVSGTNAGITVNDGTVNTILFNTSSANGSVGTTTNHPMAFYSNNAERMRITSAGSVGIGTTSVDEKLDVNGNAKLTGTGRIIKFDKNGSGEDNAIYYDNTTANNNLFIGRDSSNIAFRTGGSERMRLNSSGQLGIGTVAPNKILHLETSGETVQRMVASTTNLAGFYFGDSGNGSIGQLIYDNSSDAMRFNTNGSERMRIDSNGQIGISGSTASFDTTGAVNGLQLYYETDSGLATVGSYSGGGSTQLTFHTNSGGGASSEHMRLDASGNLLVGKTASGVANIGAELQSSGFTSITRDGGPPLQLNRKTSNGDIAVFKKDGSTVGSIGTLGGRMYAGSGDVGVFFDSTNNAITPYSTDANDTVDNAIDLGVSSRRYKDLRLSGRVYATHIELAASGSFINFENSNYSIQGSATNGYLRFLTSGTERMRLDSAGNLLVGTTASEGPSTLSVVETTTNSAAIGCRHTLGAGEAFVRFINSNNTSVIGSVNNNGNTGTTYNTTSDIRLKTDIEPIDHATDMLMAMNPVSHKWKADPDADAVVGFIAQEMQEIVPEAVSKGDNEDDMWSMDYGRITPVLVAALQDAHKKIEELATEVAKLKAN